MSNVRTRSQSRAESPDHLDTRSNFSGNNGQLLTPSVKSRVHSMAAKELIGERSQHVSPGLAWLRQTPAGTLKSKQQLLIDKHEQARSHADRICVGGGVSLWPDMDDMRLTTRELLQLVIACCFIIFIVIAVFLELHGFTIERLNVFTSYLFEFSNSHPITFSSQEVFENSTLNWHKDFNKLLEDIHLAFDVSRPSLKDQLFIIIYIVILIVLLYYLLDSMFSANKLSPSRIKIWVSLLVGFAAWSMAMVFMLLKAQRVERMIESAVHSFTEHLGDVVLMDLRRDKFHSVLLYWHTRCLPPMTPGTLRILGVLPVRDVSLYLQFYSLPVVTVIVTPPARLLASLYRIYFPASKPPPTDLSKYL